MMNHELVPFECKDCKKLFTAGTCPQNVIFVKTITVLNALKLKVKKLTNVWGQKKMRMGSCGSVTTVGLAFQE